jgi:hypothetical protein
MTSFTSALSGIAPLKISWDIGPNGILDYLKIDGNTVLENVTGTGSTYVSTGSTFTSDAHFVANTGYSVSVHDAYYDPTTDEFIVRGRFVAVVY